MRQAAFREKVLGDSSGAGTTGIDYAHARSFFEGVGAEIMGAAMFGLHAHPEDGWTLYDLILECVAADYP